MTRLATNAHCLDEEFEALILKDYGVRVVDKTDEPWNVVFEGERAQLVAMYNKHWSQDDEDRLTEASDLLTEAQPGEVAETPAPTRRPAFR